MKKPFYVALVAILASACSTSQQAQFNAFRAQTAPFVIAAEPIAAGLVDALATSQGAGALVPVINDLFGGAAAAWAQQPATTGMASPAVANTVAPIISGVSSNVQATALTLAAYQLQGKAAAKP